MHAFVTGSTGLLGNHLVPQLLHRGHSVTALVRSGKKADALFGDAPVERVDGDLRNVASFEESLNGCDSVFHLAAYFRVYRGSEEERALLHAVNVEATAQLVEAARQHGVSTFVFVSSAAVLRPDAKATSDGVPAYDEETKNLYVQSKIEAEKAVLRLARRDDDMRIVVVRPSMMLGPKDLGPTPAGRFVTNFLNEDLPVVPPGRVLVSDARDVAGALVEAAARGQHGRAYTLGGHLVPFDELMKVLEATSGVPAPTRRPPYVVASLMLGLLERLGKEVPMRREDLRRLRRLVAPDDERARQDLRYRSRPLKDTVADTVQWFLPSNRR